MSQHPVEMILVRHLASRLGVPVFVVDTAGDLIYFNEPAERVLGRRFDEIEIMTFDRWTAAFVPATVRGPLSVDELPLVVALQRRIPAHSQLDILSGDGTVRTIEATAFPILAPDRRFLGAVAMFWEVESG